MSFFLTSLEAAIAVPVGVVAAATISVLGVRSSNKTTRETNAVALQSAERRQTESLKAEEMRLQKTLKAAGEEQTRTIRAQRDVAHDERVWTRRLALYEMTMEKLDALDNILTDIHILIIVGKTVDDPYPRLRELRNELEGIDPGGLFHTRATSPMRQALLRDIGMLSVSHRTGSKIDPEKMYDRTKQSADSYAFSIRAEVQNPDFKP